MRIGVFGWSYGGYMTLRLMTEPGVTIAAGSAGAAPSHWRNYDTYYTERYLGVPVDDEVYRAASVLPRLGALRGRLLLMHGTADDNVLFENATELVAALQRAGAGFDLMIYPGQRHDIADPVLRRHQWRTYLEFFRRELGAPLSPDASPAQ
jgi:dipeptidyl-peptidase-4